MDFYFSSGMPIERHFDNLGRWPAYEVTHHRTIRKTILRAVKLTSILLSIVCLHVSANTTAQKLSLSIRNGSPQSLFATIEQKIGSTVFYNAMDLKSARPITIDIKDASMEEVLQTSLKAQALTYFIQEKTMFIRKEVAKPREFRQERNF